MHLLENFSFLFYFVKIIHAQVICKRPENSYSRVMDVTNSVL